MFVHNSNLSIVDESRIGIRNPRMVELICPHHQTVNGKMVVMTLDGTDVCLGDNLLYSDYQKIHEIDMTCDLLLPGISIISNIGILIFKCLICPLLKQETIQKSHLFTYIQNKSLARCFMGLIPIISMLVFSILLIACATEKDHYTYIGGSGLALRFACSQLRSDPKTVLSAVKQNGLALEFASDQLKNDPDIVLAAVKQNGMALQFADGVDQVLDQILDQKIPEKGIHEMIKNFIGFRAKNDKKTVLAAVKQNGLAIQFATVKLRNDLEIALAAVRQDPRAHQYLSKTLQNNEEILAAAMPQSSLAG